MIDHMLRQKLVNIAQRSINLNATAFCQSGSTAN
jgi:hypothetical protein